MGTPIAPGTPTSRRPAAHSRELQRLIVAKVVAKIVAKPPRRRLLCELVLAVKQAPRHPSLGPFSVLASVHGNINDTTHHHSASSRSTAAARRDARPRHQGRTVVVRDRSQRRRAGAGPATRRDR